MSTHQHACVWIDHRQAKIFGIGLDGADATIVHESGPNKHVHRKADDLHQGKGPLDDLFLAEIADAMGGATAILIAGPGSAKDELTHYLEAHRPQIATRIWAVEPMDHPTDPEIVASARRFFRAADRMHP